MKHSATGTKSKYINRNGPHLALYLNRPESPVWLNSMASRAKNKKMYFKSYYISLATG